MTPAINETLTILEVVLINEESPNYIEVSYQCDSIYVLLSKPDYKYSKIEERIHGIFEVLEQYCPDILEQYSIIVEALDEQELSELFKLYRGDD